MQQLELDPPSVAVTNPTPPAPPAPVQKINTDQLKVLGQKLGSIFDTYKQDRHTAEQKWLKNLRQYLGIYDPEIEKELGKRSRAYPKLTRVKCISVLSRIINLMFPGNEKNWTLKASPSPDMKPEDVQAAVAKVQARQQEMGLQPNMDEETIERAVKELACERAEEFCELIDDQLQEIGGDQSLDYVHLNRKVVASGILYGLGVMRGPYLREEKQVSWGLGPDGRGFAPTERVVRKPMFEHVPVWDFYPDMSAKTLQGMDGYFIRLVMSRSQVLALKKRSDFFPTVIDGYMKGRGQGNFKPLNFETELRTMGVKINVNDQKADSQKYEIIVWHGPVSCDTLVECGVEIPEDKRADEIDAEVWMLDGNVIKAQMNPWVMLGCPVKTIHTFLFDEDDTSPVGNALPNVMRDSQMGLCAATRMLYDNASITCGPNLEVNTDRMRADQDLTAIAAHKIWYSEGTGADAQYPAVRNVAIDSHMQELLQIVELNLKFADQETFVGPATGGDMERGPSEPMRTAAGASMIRGDAALPFKDIIRNFDTFTASVITSLVYFNRKFNPDKAKEGDYNIITRGATSLMAKEVRGMQLDQMAQTLTEEDKQELDHRKFLRARLGVRDLDDMMITDDESKRRQQGREQNAQRQQAQQDQMVEAQVREVLANAFNKIAQGQKNSAAGDATKVNSALAVLELAALGDKDGEDGSKARAGG